jgi:hypothetical protein
MHAYMLPMQITFCFYCWSCSLPSSFLLLQPSVQPGTMGNMASRRRTERFFPCRGTCIDERDDGTTGEFERFVPYNHQHAQPGTSRNNHAILTYQGDRQAWPAQGPGYCVLPRSPAIKEALTTIPCGGTASCHDGGIGQFDDDSLFR